MRVCPRCRSSYGEEERYCQRDAMPLADERDYLRVGATVGNYRLVDVLGRGGMGTVYRAEHIYIGKPVAVKILHERFVHTDAAVKRFLREARAASAIAHPNIVDVTDFGPMAEGGVYIAMELLEGASLEEVIGREAPFALHRAIGIVDQLASALSAAHDKGIVHRDLKPENVMLIRRPGRRELVRAELGSGEPRYVVEPETEFDFVKVLDFGIAKVLQPDAGREDGDAGGTMAGTIVGTPEYMAPEAAKGLPVDHRVDIYALGVLFYDMLTGHVPFEGESVVEILAKHISSPPVPPRAVAPLAEITEAAERLILKALAKEPAGRQQTMEALRAELRSCYGSVAYRRHAVHVPGARGAGVSPRPRRLTDELDEWLQAHRAQLDEARRQLEALAAQAAAEDGAPDSGRGDPEAGGGA